jgi:hypothetical protein
MTSERSAPIGFWIDYDGGTDVAAVSGIQWRYTNMGQDVRRQKDEELTGTDLPNADGTVSDEDVNAIDDNGRGKTGQDHSTDDKVGRMPDRGVGAIQDSSDTRSDDAKIID